ncbi:unnamed protein product [Rhizophagus irregularis]|nr:unnamed protein product [Rhizophagus irregularis]
MDNEIDEIAWPEETNNASENQLSSYNESDTDGEIVNINEVALTISDLFNDWESVQEHNHQCDPESIELAPKNLWLSQQIIDKIEHYTTNGNLGAEQQYKLLVQEFPQYNIAKKTCIMQFKSSGGLEFTIKLMLPRCFYLY